VVFRTALALARRFEKTLENTALALYFQGLNQIHRGGTLDGARLRSWLAACAAGLWACLAAAPAVAADQPLDPGFAASAGLLNLKSAAALVIDQREGRTLYAKNTQSVVPIASITKLMTAMVVLDARLPLEERVSVTEADVDDLKGTRSRLRIGTALTRDDLLRLALMASENRAASALSRAYPGGPRAFVAAMNQKAVELGMWRTRFADGTGLSSDNVSTAQDLAKLVEAAMGYPLIRDYTTQAGHTVRLSNGRLLQYRNSNGLVKNPAWQIGLSKTGYISEAGRCLVMQARIAATPVVIVLLDSWGKYSRIGDANRIKKWIESNRQRGPAG
jgi:D-alanyl-D-alanine endopeptidase (penicillin-binding protein 7)